MLLEKYQNKDCYK